MEGNIVNKFFSKIKNKISTNNKDSYPQGLEYAFSSQEISDLEKQNKEKIKELKKNVLNNSVNKETFSKTEEKVEVVKDIIELKELEMKEEKAEELENSYINLSCERQKIIMDVWHSIDVIKLDRYINKGKDILAHNYTITYGDEALAYIYKIRNEYDVLIEYLIGFNNEKKGIYNKTIFSDKLDNEWHHLSSYVKVLEKIRSVKK